MEKRSCKKTGKYQDTRKVRMLIGSPGGNAGKGSNYYRVSIPPVWAKMMGVSNEDRTILLTFDGEKIKVEKAN